MKLMKSVDTNKILVLFTILLMTHGMVACGKKSNNGSNGRVGAARGNIMATGNTLVAGQIPTTCATTTNSYGRVIDNGGLFGQFRNNYAEFLGQEIGDLDGSATSLSTGVDIQLKLKNSNGQIDAAQSKLSLFIVDSQAATEGELQVTYTTAQSASYNSQTGEITVVFSDEYGQVTVVARNFGQQVQGSLSFQNAGASAKSLGSFTLNSCGVFY